MRGQDAWRVQEHERRRKLERHQQRGSPVRCYALAIDPQTPDTVYVGTNYGMYKSTNGGATWSAINNGLTADSQIRSLAIDPQTPSTIYAGGVTFEFLKPLGEVYKSTNGGADWIAINSGLRRIDFCSGPGD